MSFKAVIKAIFFLILLFVMLYVGMSNTENIAFSFPVALSEKVTAPAAIIFFGIFAVGVLAGTLLHGSGGGSGGGGGKKSGGSKEK